ncbi:MAG: translation initiation factor IF-3 [Desulfatiglandales bacterium]
MQTKEGTAIGKKNDDVRVNERIYAKTVRLISNDGEQLGIMTVDQALETAKQNGLDLVEVAPNVDPPVCRIMDYGKVKYHTAKKGQGGKKKSKAVQLKEIRLRPHTEEHDLGFKIKNIKKFLEKKDRVKITVQFRGREMAYMNTGIDLMKRIADEVGDLGTVEQPPTREGWRLSMVLVPA